MYDQILRLLFKLKEDVKGQRNNIEDNLISCDCLCTNMNCHQHYSLQSSNKSVVSFIPSPVFGSLSAQNNGGFKVSFVDNFASSNVRFKSRRFSIEMQS